MSTDPSSDGGGSLQDRITARLARMTPAERQVAEYLRAHSRSAIFATAEQIAAEAGTSDATVVRTARTLGYSGLLELRHSLTAEAVQATSPAAHLGDDQADGATSPRALLERVFAEAATRLDDTLARLRRDEERVGAAIALVAGAEETLAFGVGPSELVAGYLALRLRRIGRRARSTGATGTRLAEDLVGLGARDAVVLYAPSRPRREIEVVLDHAAAVGAGTVLVSDSLGTVFGDRVDVVLPALHTGGVTGEGLTSQTLTDVLALGVAAADEDRTTTHTDLLTALRGELGPTGGRRRPPGRRRPSDRPEEEST